MRAIIALVVMGVGVTGMNFCVMTDVCPYIYHPNKTMVFFDTSLPSAELMNKVVDWGIQPGLMAITVAMYILTGARIIRVRGKVQTQGTSNTSLRKSKLEYRLFLQGLIVTLPHALVIIIYHIMFYLPSSQGMLLQSLDLSTYFFMTLGYVLNPTLHLIVNKDLRMKTIQCWCAGTLTSLEKGTLVPMGSRVSRSCVSNK